MNALHVINTDDKIGYVTKTHRKKTALQKRFLNGQSHHPSSVNKSKAFGETIRLRRLHKLDTDYLEALEKLKLKCVF